jgi:hypothetical protein
MKGDKHHRFFCCAEHIPEPDTVTVEFMPFFYFLKYGRPVATSKTPTSGHWFMFTKVEAESSHAHYLFRPGQNGGYSEVSEQQAKDMTRGSHESQSLEEVELKCPVHGYSRFFLRKKGNF